MAYPNMLAGGVTAEGTFDPAELFCGEADIISDHGVVGASNVAQLVPVARGSNGLIVAWDDLAGAASLAGTFSGVGTANDTITINGIVFTLVASSANAHQVTIGGTADATAVNFAAKVNADQENTHVRAVRTSSAVITLYALEPGAAGNSIAVSESGTGFSFAGGATALAGGIAESESRAIGISAQAAIAGDNIPYWTGGVFNHNLITWPASIDTLAKRKQAFDRTNIQIDAPKGVSTRMTIP